MHEATPPADDFHEELDRRDKERERRVWFELVEKHVLPEKDSINGLVFALLGWQSLESRNPDFRRDIPGNLLPIYWEAVSRTKEAVKQACSENDDAFLRRLSEASTLIAKGKIPQPLDKLTITGIVLIAWGQLCDELGHRPGRSQLRIRAEELRRKQDGVGANSKISDRRWDDILKELRPLFPENKGRAQSFCQKSVRHFFGNIVPS